MCDHTYRHTYPGVAGLVQHSMRRELHVWFMAALAREEEKASKHRQRKREAEEADKVEVVPGVTVASY